MDQIEDPSFESEEVNLRDFARQISEESGNSLMSNNEGKKRDAPPVPPRIKKAGSRGSSVTKDTDSLKDVDIFDKDVKYEYEEAQFNEPRSAGLAKQEVDSDLSKRDPVQSETSPVKESRSRENKAINLQVDMSPKRDATFENRNAQGTQKVKRKAPLRPDHLNTPDDNGTNHLVADEPETTNRASEETSEHAEAAGENPRDIISPLLLVNGVSINQSPPDQGSLSSKSSYFSVESAMHRNTETESNVYRSLENLIGEVDEVDEDIRNISRNTKEDSDRTELEYYSLSDHENEPELVKPPVKSPQKETEVLYTDSKKGETTTAEALDQDENNQTPMSPSNIISPTLGIPALFKVKDNTFTNKMRSKTVQPWSPRGSLSGSEKGEESHQVKESLDLPLPKEPDTRASSPIPDETFKPEEVLLQVSSPMPLSPADLQSESPKKPQVGGFLTVPLEEDRLSGVSPLSEGVESLATSAADTSDEMGLSAVVSKVPRERSVSTCSGSESQTGLPKPPVVLPKSEKAVLKAIKIANRRMKKEEAQKSSHKSTQSSSKHRVDRHKSDKSEHKSSRSSKSSERNHREKTEDGYRHNDKNSQEQSEQQPCERRGDRRENRHQTQTDVHQKTRTQSRDPVESSSQNSEVLPSVEPERPGRSSKKHMREKPEQRHYSSDRVISNVPVYKTQQGDRPTSDRPFNRSQSIDRYLGEKVERRLSTDTSMNEKVDLRTQRIEKSIMDELQQRGRAKEKPSRDNPTRRSHSIDAYPNPNPSNLSRQSSYSSHTSQLSRQSSIEHAIVTQSFPMTQRKLLQDPDSGQYFFVDMPVQVKTKTFFDPETGSYVQLPVQPPEGAVPQASTLEVLTQPMVVYHSFVPVPLSPMTQTSIQASHMEPRMRQMHCQEGHPYLEPVYGQPDHMLGEFLGTEELDCPS
ncbi:hypothetical protein PBY51_001361 [Eleginops maclovinus]|nr:hypothetical protein PBY51_001361 [Eleginops maclovinus]